MRRRLVTSAEQLQVQAIEDSLYAQSYCSDKLRPMPHVLVVDDHENTAKAMTALLRRLGYDASCALNANDALESLRNKPTALVLLDVMMPQTSGLRLLETMRADSSLAGVPVIIHSAYCDPVTQSEALRLGAVSYLLKDYLPLNKIREVIETYAGKADSAPATVAQGD